jgi:hypothetical protein
LFNISISHQGGNLTPPTGHWYMKNIASQEGQYIAITGPYNKRKADHKFCGSLMQHLPYTQNIRLVWPNYCVNNRNEHQKDFLS